MKNGEAASSDPARVTAAVRAFYEDHPYPPAVDSLDRYRDLWHDGHRRRAEHHLFWPSLPYREDHSILIAGCGTSQAAKHALRWPQARVTGIDFSARSVASTEALKHKHKLDNLQVRQLPVEQAGELETSFDQIVCTGVLHHLPDPDAGLRALRDVLAPQGAMHLMVYAPYGRTGIYMLQEFCRRLGIRAVDDEIRDLIAALAMLPRGHPLENLLREAPDFRNEAALADALLNPQDRAYSVPQLFEFIEGAGLRFGRWVKQAPYDPQCGAVAKIPQMSGIARLPLAEQYAAARAVPVAPCCVTRRWCYRADSGVQPSRFRGGWLAQLCADPPAGARSGVEERLPPGAAAVLINRAATLTPWTSTYRSIRRRSACPMRSMGSRTIREMLQPHGPLRVHAISSSTALAIRSGRFRRYWR